MCMCRLRWRRRQTDLGQVRGGEALARRPHFTVNAVQCHSRHRTSVFPIGGGRLTLLQGERKYGQGPRRALARELQVLIGGDEVMGGLRREVWSSRHLGVCTMLANDAVEQCDPSASTILAGGTKFGGCWCLPFEWRREE